MPDATESKPHLAPYYEDEFVSLYLGDWMEVLPELGLVADLVVTDPPYFQPSQHYSGTRGAKATRPSWGDRQVLQHAFNAWAVGLEPYVSEAGTLYVFCDGQSYPLTHSAFYSWGRCRPLVWDRLVSFNGYTWRHQHELIAWIERSGAERVPTGDGDVLRERGVLQAVRTHPAEKPVALVSRLIAKHNPSLVLDPFVGSGTTLRAAKDLGFRGVGVEIEERYCELAAERMAQEVLAVA